MHGELQQTHSGQDNRIVACQILVFHFPRVIQRVKGGVPKQIPERPGAGRFALSVELPNGSAIGVAVRAQSLVGQQRVFRSVYPKFRSPVLLRAQRMPDNAVPVPPLTSIGFLGRRKGR